MVHIRSFADSIKRTIRLHKSGNEGSVNPASASGIEILERFKVTSKGEPFLLYDSGFGDINRVILVATSKMFSILKASHYWFADGTFKVAPQQFYQLYTIHAEKDGYVFPCVYSLVTKKDELTYMKIMRKLVELEPELDSSYIMVDFEKAAINCFMILMADFPQSAMEVAEYFEETYIGRRLPDQTRRLPPFPVRFWSMYTRVLNQTARTNNSVEGWHNAFQSGLSSPHPNFPKLMKHLQREQAIQDVNVAKWESGNIHLQSKSTKERNERLLNLVLDYDNRETRNFRRRKFRQSCYMYIL